MQLSKSKRQLKTLIADDNVDIARMMSLLMRRYAMCDLVSNGKEALDAICRAQSGGSPYQLVLLDIDMPKLRGTEVVIKIRELEEKSGIREERKLCVIMTTCSQDREDVMASIMGGCQAYLVKPFTQLQLETELVRLGVLERDDVGVI